jgi:YVTN family beta-propeller protein
MITKEPKGRGGAVKGFAIGLLAAIAALADGAHANASAAVAAKKAPSLYKPVARFDVGGEGGWDYIVYDASSGRLFVGHNKEIAVLDARTGEKVGAVPANGAHGAAVVPEKGLGFSTNGRGGTVTVFDLKTLAPKQDIATGQNPDAILYDRYSKKVIVMNGGSKDVAVIDPDTLKIVARVPLGGKLEAATSDPRHVYVNVEDTGEIVSVDSKTWKADHRWKLSGCEEPTGMGIDEEKHRLFTVCGNKKMVVVDAADGHLRATLDIGAGTDGAGFDPGMGYALASNGADGTLTVVREDKQGKYDVAESVPTQRGARTMAVDPSSHRVFLPTAELGPPAEGQRRPSIKPGTFVILVYGPAN